MFGFGGALDEADYRGGFGPVSRLAVTRADTLGDVSLVKHRCRHAFGAHNRLAEATFRIDNNQPFFPHRPPSKGHAAMVEIQTLLARQVAIYHPRKYASISYDFEQCRFRDASKDGVAFGEERFRREGMIDAQRRGRSLMHGAQHMP